MNYTLFLPWLSLLIGIMARVFIPWLAVRQQNPDKGKWAWEYVWPQLLSAGLILLVLPLVIADLTVIQSLPYQAAWLVGWAAADLGRKAYKMVAKDEG